MANNHVILKQVLEFKFHQAETNPNSAQAARDIFMRDGVPALQSALDDIDTEQQVIRIDRLEIDLGLVDEERMGNVFRADLKKMAYESIKTRIQTGTGTRVEDFAAVAPSEIYDTGGVRNKEFQTGPISNEATETTESPPIALSEEQEIVEFVLHFLQTGMAPWWSAISALGDSKTTALKGKVVSSVYQKSDKLRHSIYSLFRRYPHATLARLTTEAWLQPLVKHLQDIAKTANKNSTEGFFPHMSTAADGASSDQEFKSAEEDIELTKLTIGLLTGAGIAIADFASKSLTGASKNVLDSHADMSIEGAGQSGGNGTNVAGHGDDDQTEKKDSETEAFFIDNAGVILLQPFMVLLFDELGYLNDRDFRDHRCRVKAIRILEYLVWGTVDRAEFALQLEKKLCALPGNIPLLPAELTESELAEADSVLDATITHWSILKNTSRDGLRSTFLQRNGKLIPGSEQDKLIVERNSMDVLLSKIPWAFNIVRLPWMPRPLMIEW